MAQTPKTVSVIIPTHNRPDLLRRAVASVESQTYRDFELIVIEDVDSHGGGWARNQGIKKARGKFIAFLDDDDAWMPDKLAIQMNALENTPPDVGFCFSAVRNVYDDRTFDTKVPEGVNNYHLAVLKRFKTFLNVTLVIKRSVFDEVGMFDERFPSHQEADLMIRVSKKFKGVGINQPLVLVNMRPHEQTGGSLDRKIAGRKMILKKYIREYIMRPKILFSHLLQIVLWYKALWKQRPAVKIVLMDFGGYRLHREKIIGDDVIKCGIGPILENIKKFRAGLSFGVILVINDVVEQSTYVSLKENYSFIEKIIFRDNKGFDFGAYDAGWKYLKEMNWTGDVVFMNSSARGPNRNNWLRKYSRLFHRKNIGLCGASMNSHATHKRPKVFMPHVQSFFLYTGMAVLQNVFKNDLPGSMLSNRQEIVENGEIGLSQAVLHAGYGISCMLFKNFTYFESGPWTIPAGDMRYKEKFSRFANQI